MRDTNTTLTTSTSFQENRALDAHVIRLDRQHELGFEVLCLADVTPKPIDWLWRNWFARGKVHVLAGEGGRGKSTILCDIASRTTRGEPWPDGSANAGRGSVIILAAEDDPEDTLAPRLLAVGADMQRIYLVRAAGDPDRTRRAFNLQTDLARLEALIREKGDVSLVILDPVSSYLGKVDSHKNAEVRTVLEPLGDLAARLHVAVICNNHFSKGGGNANNRIIGSVAFVNQARAAFIVTPDPDDNTRLLLIPSKTNIGPMSYGLAYRLEGVGLEVNANMIVTSRVAWDSSPVTITADQALAACSAAGEGKSARSEAEMFLRETLANGPVPQKDVKDAVEGAGLAWATMRRAKNKLGVKTQRVSIGMDGSGHWVWSLAAATCSADVQDARV